MNNGTIVAVVLIWFVCAIGSAAIAERKGLSGTGYFFLGLFFGILGLIIAACQPATQQPISPAGWYEDPWHLSPRRWFDGHQWTGHVQ